MISRGNPSACLSVFIPLSLSLSLSESLSLSAISSWNRSKSLTVQNVAKIPVDDLHIFYLIEITLIQCSMFDFHGFLRDLSSSLSVE